MGSHVTVFNRVVQIVHFEMLPPRILLCQILIEITVFSFFFDRHEKSLYLLKITILT